MISNRLINYILASSFISYLFIHPLLMAISYIMHDYSQKLSSEELLSEILKSFSIPMLPFSLGFALIGGVVGLFYYRLKQANEDKSKLITQLEISLSEIKKLSGFLPICASCKKIRDDEGYWNQIETYIKEHSEADFTHGICPECEKRLYPELD